MNNRVVFMTYQGKQILLIDVTDCSPDQVETTFRSVPDIVTARPPRSMLILSDFTSASVNEHATQVVKETAVFDKPYVKRSACVGVESLPHDFIEDLNRFALREFRIFKTREKALAWLVKD